MSLAGRVLVERLAVDVFRNQVPFAVRRLPGPVDLDHVRVLDLPQRADLPAHSFIASGAIEELESALFTFDLIEDPVDLGEATLPENFENLEPSVNDVTDRIVEPPWPLRTS